MESLLPTNEYVTQQERYLRLYLPRNKPRAVLVNAARDTVALARGLCIFSILVEATHFMEQQPSIFEMFAMVVEAAAMYDARLRLGVVDATQTLIRDNFVVTSALNRGMTIAVFANQAEALAWLLPEDR